jgi:tRNA(Arg) A34 adenosine deaminase TadA
MAPEDLMRLAIGLAEEGMARGHGGPFGALVVRDGEVVATGFNQVISLNDPTAHAEVQAIRAACRTLGTFQLAGCDVYASCEPCPMCLGALYWARPRAVYFSATRHEAAAAGFDDRFLWEELVRVPEARRLRLEPLLPGEGARPFAAWLRRPDRVRY